MAWLAGSSACPSNPSSVITGLEPVIHAMTVQKHCPQTRPTFLAASPRG
jgi:hypothetical protein